MKFMLFSIKFGYSDILLTKHKLHLSRFSCCYHTCYCVNILSVTSASRNVTSASCYHPRYQSRSSMYICGLIPRNFAELAEVVPNDHRCEGRIEKSVPRIAVLHHEACRVMTKGDPQVRIFYLTLT